MKYKVLNLRDFSKKKMVDDRPFGGGAGMLLKIEPIVEALEFSLAEHPESYKILLSPQGTVFTQKDVLRLNEKKSLIFICGHYEGIDARINNYVDEELSIGSFITMGGEIPALVLTEALIRAIPGAIKKSSFEEETFTNNLLDFDSFTHPRSFRGLSVPETLLSGNHKKIAEWREKNIQKKLQKTLKQK